MRASNLLIAAALTVSAAEAFPPSMLMMMGNGGKSSSSSSSTSSSSSGSRSSNDSSGTASISFSAAESSSGNVIDTGYTANPPFGSIISTSGVPSFREVVTLYTSENLTGGKVTVELQVSGFSTDPTQASLNEGTDSVICGNNLATTLATYSYASGTATWTWPASTNYTLCPNGPTSATLLYAGW